MAPTTELGVKTSTTPNGKPLKFGSGFLGPELVKQISQKGSYVARTSVSQPEVVKATIKKALENQTINNSFSFVEVLSICPTNWKTDAQESFNRLEKMQDYYKLGEIKDEQN